MNFDEFAQSWSSDDQIPSEDLYGFLEPLYPVLLEQYQHDPGVIPKTRLGLEIRRRCQRDLFWLARYFTWCTNPEGIERPISDNKVTEDPYGMICRDFFVQKDPTKKLTEQDEVKRRVFLWPRYGFKSTLDVVDTVQWILCFSDVRVFFITAAEDLAVGFVGEVKGHFILKEDASWMNIFWPEFCVADKDSGNQFEFTCPVFEAKKTKRKEPTVYATSVGSNQSGWHCDVMKPDDAVSNKNSETVEMCHKVRAGMHVSRKMLRPGGHLDYIGTRYDDEDLYGEALSKNLGEVDTTYGRGWTLHHNKTTGTKILIGRAITIKPEVAEQLRKEGKPVKYTTAGEAGCDLLVPHVLSYSFLMKEYAEDEISFEGQYNQDPRPPSATPFTRELLLQNTVDFKQLPYRGPISHTWDLAFSTKKKRDYTTGCSVIWNEQGVAFVRNLVRDRFNPTDMAKAVVGLALQDHPFIIGIEDAGGSRLIEPTIQAEAAKTGDPEVIAVCNRIEWYPMDNQKDAKKARMSTMHPWFTAGRLKLAKHLPFLEIAYNEIERCTLHSSHDDIPDVISRQMKYAPQIAREIQKKGIENFSRLDLGWNLLYEDGVDFTTGRGYLLVHNPETGEMEWQSQPIANPVSIPVARPDTGPPAETPYGVGFDPILGSGLFG